MYKLLTPNKTTEDCRHNQVGNTFIRFELEILTPNFTHSINSAILGPQTSIFCEDKKSIHDFKSNNEVQTQ